MSFQSSLRLPADSRELARIRGFVEQQAGLTPASTHEIRELIQAVDEAASNIIMHGYQNHLGEIEVILEYQPGRIMVTLRDQAAPFDPTTLPNPNLDLPLEDRPVGGLGVYFIRMCVNEVSHSVTPEGGNQLKLVKHLKNKGAPPPAPPALP